MSARRPVLAARPGVGASRQRPPAPRRVPQYASAPVAATTLATPYRRPAGQCSRPHRGARPLPTTPGCREGAGHPVAPVRQGPGERRARSGCRSRRRSCGGRPRATSSATPSCRCPERGTRRPPPPPGARWLRCRRRRGRRGAAARVSRAWRRRRRPTGMRARPRIRRRRCWWWPVATPQSARHPRYRGRGRRSARARGRAYTHVYGCHRRTVGAAHAHLTHHD